MNNLRELTGTTDRYRKFIVNNGRHDIYDIYDEIPDKVGREKTALDHQVKEKLDDLVDLDEAQKLLEVKRLNDWMKSASEQLNFELATVLRDKIYELQGKTSQGKSRLKTR